MIITKTKIMSALIRNLPVYNMQAGALINAIYPDCFDLIAEEVAGTPEFVKSHLVNFQEVAAFEKTTVYTVRDKKSGVLLGRVYWHPPYYGYAFFPEQDTIYDPLQLSDILGFIESLMFLHREKKNKNDK